ncbi:hypothetical protein HMI54_013042, partial [Coelomomyces lativittatus]
IDYIFADKTGTLTCNEMVVRSLSIGGQVYGKIPNIAKESLEADDGEDSNANDNDVSSISLIWT